MSETTYPRILTQDPSFKALAFCIYDGEDTIYIDNCHSELGQNIGFERVFTTCQSLWCEYRSKLDTYPTFDYIFSEIPPPVGNFAAGLYALDTLIMSHLECRVSNIENIFIFSPSYLSTIHNTRKYNKSDSTQLAKFFMNEVLQDHFKFVLPDTVTATGKTRKGVMNNDRAEAFLFMLRAFCRFNVKGLRNTIIEQMAGLGVEAEKPLHSTSTKEE